MDRHRPLLEVDLMKCTKCNAENPEGKRFCGDCGSPLENAVAQGSAEASPAESLAVPGQERVWYCARHTKVTTLVRCGRCETPICTRCMVHSPAGVRCRDCARNRVPVRPMGMLHEVGRTVGPNAQGVGRVVWYMAIWFFILNLFGGFFGGDRDA